jgi:hypothetical protein
MEKTAVRRFFLELGTKLTEFWDKLNLPNYTVLSTKQQHGRLKGYLFVI